MLKYIVIPLAEDAVSYCHYDKISKRTNIISEDVLHNAIRYAMLENLHTTFVFPNQCIPEKYLAIINTISHTKIASINSYYAMMAEIIVVEDLSELDYNKISKNQIVVLRISCSEIACIQQVYSNLNGKVTRVNIIVKDIDRSTVKEWNEYKSILNKLQSKIATEMHEGICTQLNLLSDRLYLTEMNNCNAGDESITLMPNGRFYPCPGFYYDNMDEDYGDLERGLRVKNSLLYKLDHAPICSHCDAYQCRRCVWLNRKTTLEVNTPSKEQCVWAHLERNSSREILNKINNTHNGTIFSQLSIPAIDYHDPFDNRNNWNK